MGFIEQLKEAFKRPEKFLDYEETMLRIECNLNGGFNVYLMHTHSNTKDFCSIALAEDNRLILKFKEGVLRTDRCLVQFTNIITGTYDAATALPIFSITDGGSEDNNLGKLTINFPNDAPTTWNVYIWKHKRPTDLSMIASTEM